MGNMPKTKQATSLHMHFGYQAKLKGSFRLVKYIFTFLMLAIITVNRFS